LELLGKHKLLKLKNKNRGNTKLIKAIDQFILDIENANWKNPIQLKQSRPDADCVHSDGFYFFDLNIHRTMVLITFEDNEAMVVWAGSHAQYDKTFKGNKETVKGWLRSQNLI
jgi:mRNA-degrading endonuclease HigB of HigAB toxin-antitoxin module